MIKSKADNPEIFENITNFLEIFCNIYLCIQWPIKQKEIIKLSGFSRYVILSDYLTDLHTQRAKKIIKNCLHLGLNPGPLDHHSNALLTVLGRCVEQEIPEVSFVLFKRIEICEFVGFILHPVLTEYTLKFNWSVHVFVHKIFACNEMHDFTCWTLIISGISRAWLYKGLNDSHRWQNSDLAQLVEH